jgi:three-Cys-motif partner protein
MKSNEKFFENLKIWSKRKHRLLEKYLPPFSAKVASTTINREVYCVDGFAGAAKYEDGSEGSPVLMAKFSDVCLNWSRPINLRIISVEPDLTTFQSLENATQDWKEKGVAENINSKFEDSIPTILNKIGNSPTLFFIDPFGPTGVRFSHLIPILRRSPAITELIINFDTDGLYRIACAAISERNNPKTAQTNAENVTSIIGSDNWLKKFTASKPTTDQGEEILLREYISNLCNYGFSVADYAIKEALNTKPKYHFIYCTRHNDGVYLMNEFIRAEDDLIYGEYVLDNLPMFQEEASLAREVESRREKLRIIIVSYLAKNNKTNRRQIKHRLMFDYFGFFDTKDYNFVVKQLLEENMLTEKTGKKRINDEDILEYFPK